MEVVLRSNSARPYTPKGMTPRLKACTAVFRRQYLTAFTSSFVLRLQPLITKMIHTATQLDVTSGCRMPPLAPGAGFSAASSSDSSMPARK